MYTELAGAEIMLLNSCRSFLSYWYPSTSDYKYSVALHTNTQHNKVERRLISSGLCIDHLKLKIQDIEIHI